LYFYSKSLVEGEWIAKAVLKIEEIKVNTNELLGKSKSHPNKLKKLKEQKNIPLLEKI
jgi:hypothetical protein